VPADLRSAFPVLERVAYLNTGSVGPVPTAAMDAVREELDDALENGRAGKAHFDRLIDMGDRLRAGVASLMGATPGEVALTGATTDGVNAVVAGLSLQPGDEVLTSDEEHPGLLAPLASARERSGVRVRVAPFAELAGAVGAQTRLVACSHVAWQTGRVADTEALAAAGAPVLLDGAQGLGAVPVDVGALGCDYYAASGQKWLCGPMGSGYLYVRSERVADLAPAAPGYQTLSDPLRALDLPLKEGAARFDGGFPPSHHLAWALASLEVLGDDGTTQTEGIERARRLSRLLTDQGLEVALRGDSTLVSWETSDPEAESARLLRAGYLVRNLPGTSYVRASVGAWTTEQEMAGLAEEAATSRS
jgi:L-cysteine/cystine lyase